MRAILPGRPNTELAAVTTGLWEGRQIIAYISGNALIILGGPRTLLQTTYHEDEDNLVAVVLDEASGKIAVASPKAVHVYKPYGLDEGALRWSLQHTLTLSDPDDTVRTLSWGIAEELLIGSARLTLFSTHHDPGEQLWSAKLSSPAKAAHFSYDATFIASVSTYDRLVKIWHRLSFGSVADRFDVAYLPHPKTVTGLHWRRPRHKEQLIENVLYTICADDKVRVWTGGDVHTGPGVFNLWAEIDLHDSIKPRTLHPSAKSRKRYTFFIDSADFAIATEKAVQQASEDAGKEQSHALNHLIEVANRTPEVCVVLDDRGNMSAWGLESVGCKARKTTDIFNVVHVEGLRLHFAKNPSPIEDNVQFYGFCGAAHGNSFTLLMHHFDGRLEWLEGKVDLLFDPAPHQEQRLERETVLTGHSGAIKKVVRTATGRSLISRTAGNEIVVWKQETTKSSGTVLARHSTVDVSEHIHRTALLQEGDFVVYLHHEAISLWDARGPKACEVARCEYHLQGKPLCLILIPEIEADSGCVHLATISSEMNGLAWEVRIPPKDAPVKQHGRPGHIRRQSVNAEGSISLQELCSFDLGSGDDLAFVLPVDPAGTAPVISGFLDTFARDVAISYTTTGIIKSWTARVETEKRKIEWLLTSTVETGIDNPSLASGTSIRKAALVDAEKTGLTIWSTRSAQLEHEERFQGHDSIQDLDWSSTPDNQSVLAVGFPHRVVIYAQLRFNYLDGGPSWAPIREIRIRDLTPHPIGDSVWLGSGNLVIGAGNQLFVQDEHVELSDGLLPDLRLDARKNAEVNLFTLVSRLNGPLPIYHPQLLAQCVLAGKLGLVQRILIKLLKILKFYTEGDAFDTFLGMSPEDFSDDQENTVHTVTQKELHSSYADFSDESDEPAAVTEEIAATLNELLATKSVPELSHREQFHLADIVECVGTVEKHRRSIDDNAGRFLLFLRQHFLRSAADRSEGGKRMISWREITWAFHSGSQDILVDLVSRHWQGKMQWVHAREVGMFMWMTDITALRAQFEIIARNEYTKTDERNPVDCSLYYLALHKKAVLQGLWRMATWSREQGATSRLLANNFAEPRWRTAALKNAYALMGKQRFEYAAAFFLLADQLKDAVRIISERMGDLQLAIAVARVYEGDDGPVLRAFLTDNVLPLAARDGNRWMATWAFWMLGKRDNAVRALMDPLTTLISPTSPSSPSPPLHSKSFLTSDPAHLVLYAQLRSRSLLTLRGALSVSPRAEWEFVLHTARLYERMGCDALALDLVRGWEFLLPTQAGIGGIGELPERMPRHSAGTADLDPRKLLRRRSSLVVQDLPDGGQVPSMLDGFGDLSLGGAGSGIEDGVANGNGNGDANGVKKIGEEEKKKPPPTQFKEPDANSLLDSFGF
ncbi:hypothetical protein K490DRAFT_31122 [Saccharata proteae CBS 121410]|uniref:RAVE complex protein Rav1 C-terminal domain-containing protein n=1 Tax=Saccharata proteae CBS 121410 TaxID=1314787 RepID=A0A9P4M2Z3_9PEZI|nr:hypothetical protein K490DRAFT_31122 [Saccharata proteae CBS 121410]